MPGRSAKAKGSPLVEHDPSSAFLAPAGSMGSRRAPEEAMTKRRDLKRRVRERQEKTGESYVTARRHVLVDPAENGPAPASPGTAIPVVEMITLTEHATRLGMKCRVRSRRRWPRA
jgi:hypothetical protein